MNMKTMVNFSYTPDPQEFDHVDDWTDEDFKEENEDDFEEDDDCATTGGCMPDPEDFDDSF